MKRFQVKLFSCVVAAVLIPLLLTTAVAQAQAAPWTVVKSPNASSGNNELFGAASVSAKNVWAVGDFTTTSGVKQTLTLHWNGHKWRVVASPNASSGNNTLLGVAAVSPTDVWAVGSFIPASGSGQALIEHWNGTSWSVVMSPGAGTSNILLGVAAVSPTDVWAVGGFVLSGFGPVQTLIEHWNGTSWSVVSSPNASTQTNELAGVTAVSANDIWAVGEFVTSGGLIQTLIEHWNGTSWSVVSSPNPSTQDNLLAAAAVSTNDVWAVGEFVAPSGVGQALIEHWNGTSWSVVTSPSAGGSNVLSGVAIISATDIWAVGDVVIGVVAQTLIEQWNGTSWSVVSSPNPSSITNLLNGASADKSSGQAWAVGGFTAASGALQTLTEFNP